MNAPTVQPGHRFAPCRCAHPKTDHDPLSPQCSHPACTCLRYQPQRPNIIQPAVAKTTMTAAPVVHMTPREPELARVEQRPPTLEQILAAGKRSEFKRTVALAERIAVLLVDLRGRLADERQAAEQKRADDARRDEAKKQIAALEAQLAEARKALNGGQRAPGTAPAISGQMLECPETGCRRTFSNGQGLAMHRRRAHEGYDPNAKSPA